MYSQVRRSSPPPSAYPPPPLTSDDSFRKSSTTRSPMDSKSHYYPASVLLMIIWIAFVAALLWLLEAAVKHGPEHFTQPWYYTTLPNILLTIFAQGHVALTAMLLARVSVSALHSPRTSPKTWAEVFWMSDNAWQGPVGIVSSLFEAWSLGVGVSVHYIVCALTCLTALVTPIVLSRAYPIESITITQGVTINPATLDVARFGAVDGYTQIGTGSGSWSSALSISEVYNSSVFLPSEATRINDPKDFFFAGDVDTTIVRLPGLRLSGQCVSMENPVHNFGNDFSAFCNAQVPKIPFISSPIKLANLNVNLTVQTCTNSSWEVILTSTIPTSKNVGFIYLQSTNGSAVSAGKQFSTVEGMVRCESTFSTGWATLDGRSRTYTNFAETVLLNFTASQQGEPLLDPMYAFMYSLDNAQKTAKVNEPTFAASAVNALGYSPLVSGAQGSWSQPTVDELAKGLWRGVSYMVTSVGLRSRSTAVSYPASQTGVTAVYIRVQRYFIVSYALIVLWLFLLLLVTVRSYRPTVAGSFDSYLTARLIVDSPNLADRSVEDKSFLTDKFGFVTRNEHGQVVVVGA
ncbi:hypothetical protein MIND_01099600 [Mycena indigotica]|uniref:Uncharacterized protein n=1 Tax=Mycena indigotica TaxID=2126181 RepID=A0A8H6S9R8_9AGAR|nr:uncharacterized protein MIND_01099600 [Mycena indigotica]KAF7295595.1 hypothetical protein MIND_01099600 [Mycena indigotica]